MHPIILSFLMLVQCQGSEINSTALQQRRDYVEELVNDFLDTIEYEIGDDLGNYLMVIGIDEEGSFIIQEIPMYTDEDMDIDEFLEELER